MPRVNLPPYVQVLRRPDGGARGYRGWWPVNGKRCFGPTRRDALAAHADAMAGRGAAQRPVAGTFASEADHWLAAIGTRATADTVAFYRGKLANLYRTIPKTLPLERLTPAVLREFVREAVAEHQLGARTIQHCRRTLNAMFTWLQRRGVVRDNPCRQVEWPKPVDTQPDVLTEAELASCLARIADPWAADLALAMAYTGLRRAEVARLRVADVDVGNRVLWVRGKARHQSQPIDPTAVAPVLRLVEAAAGREFVIPGASDKGRREKVAETFRHWQKRLHEPRWHPHALRHSVATIMLRQGTGPAAVQRFLRHSSYAMTQRYVHMVAADVRNATAQLRLVKPDEQREHG